MTKERIDVLLVERGFSETRTKAQALVLARQVVAGDRCIDKPGTRVPVDIQLRLKAQPMPYVSRGGIKLKGAIDAFQLDMRGQVCADIGASTGGFTDCMLQEGAARVYSIDVGWGSLHQKLRNDARVVNRERVNARYLTDEDLPEFVSVLAIDVSFISLKLVLPAALTKLLPGGLCIALIKPQFEVGRQYVAKGGVVRDALARKGVIDDMRDFVRTIELKVLGVMDSPLTGPAGNREALLIARRW